MNLNLTGHHVEITPAMRNYVTSKIDKITCHFDHVIDVNVILSAEKLKQKAEANVHVRGKDIFIETDNIDMYAVHRQSGGQARPADTQTQGKRYGLPQ